MSSHLYIVYVTEQCLYFVAVHRDETRSMSGGEIIRGLAVMNNELYVGRERQSEIEVYDVATLNHRRNVSIPGLGCVHDLASCPQSQVVYVSDGCSSKIYAINEREVITLLVDCNEGGRPWDEHRVRPGGLSVNSQLNVVVMWPSMHDIRVYTPGGELIRNITLQSDVTEPHQAIQLDDDRFVVVHGDEYDDLHRVCIVNSEGRIIQSYGGHKGSDVGQLNRPYRMLIVGESMIITDYWNYRLLLFNVTSLTYIRELVSTRSSSLMPVRLAISEDYTQLFVSYISTRAQLRTYNLSWN
jgi:hypothetical protein